jgi:CubicO group peptidase (beta-lactamase class C family)
MQADVDALFADDATQPPGCAVGVSVDGHISRRRGYGMADLERDVPITPETVFRPRRSAHRLCSVRPTVR